MDYKQIQEIIKGFENSNLTNLELEMESLKLKLNKSAATNEEVVVVNRRSKEAYSAESSRNQVSESTGNPVKSPLVGTYYAASSPDEEPFVKVGQRIEQGETVCIIEAMKIMNEITAPVSGVVKEINIENGQVVGFDQVILTIE